MKKKNHTISIGVYMFLAIAVFFLAMKLFGLEQYSELRLLNILIVLYFTNKLALLNYIEDSEIGYLENMSSLFLANAISVLMSAFGMMFYLRAIDPGFLQTLENGFFFGHHLTVLRVFFGLLIEGIAISIVASFSLMQYWKDYKRVSKKVDLTNSDH
jgi:hypothetical protein